MKSRQLVHVIGNKPIKERASVIAICIRAISSHLPLAAFVILKRESLSLELESQNTLTRTSDENLPHTDHLPISFCVRLKDLPSTPIDQSDTMKLPLLSTLLCCLSTATSFSLQPALSAVNAAFEGNPYAAGAFVAGFKASTADIIAQRRQIRKVSSEKKAVETNRKASKGLDIQRTLGFLLYGAIYQGLAQEYTYNHLYPILFGTETTTINVLKKVFCDMFVQTPVLTLPIAYYSKALLVGNSFKEAMEHYVEDIKKRGLLFKFWALWTPVQCMTFSIIPEHFRVSFIALVSFFWVIILSSLSAAKDFVANENTESNVKVNGARQIVSEKP